MHKFIGGFPHNLWVKNLTSLFSVKGVLLDMARTRLVLIGVCFVLFFSVIAGRLGYLMILTPGEDGLVAGASQPVFRADILDRRGEVLATSLTTQSLYANPSIILDVNEAVGKLHRLFPDLDAKTLQQKLSLDRGFVWLKRNLTPKQQQAVIALGLPGIDLQREEKRIYPHGGLFAHVLGCTDVDNRGVSGIEKFFDESLMSDQESLILSVDARLQHVVRDELKKTIKKFNAIGGMGLVMDVQTGEVLSMVSAPDFDPNNVNNVPKQNMFNMATLGVYEIGSTMKILTTAMALDTDAISMDTAFDISAPIKVGRFTIKDYHPIRAVAGIPTIFTKSSNIGFCKIAQALGITRQKEYLDRFRLTVPSYLELPEMGKPLLPKAWTQLTGLTLSYGYGAAFNSIQIATAVGAVVNGGTLRRATLLKQDGEAPGVRVVSESTSRQLRQLLRLTIELGTGRKANAEGYEVVGKSGTAEKSSARGYMKDKNIVSFISAFPFSNPRYVIIVMVDEPKGIKESFGFRTAGWVAAPLAKEIIRRIAPLVQVYPTREVEEVPDVQVLRTNLMEAFGAGR